jgi:hypothetical protein
MLGDHPIFGRNTLVQIAGRGQPFRWLSGEGLVWVVEKTEVQVKAKRDCQTDFAGAERRIYQGRSV